MARYDFSRDPEWERFVDSVRKGSFEKIIDALQIIADFDKDKLKVTVYEYAAQTIEELGLEVSKNRNYLHFLMRSKYMEVGKKVYLAYQKRMDFKHKLISRPQDIESVVKAEKKEGISYTHAWVVTSQDISLSNASFRMNKNLPVITR